MNAWYDWKYESLTVAWPIRVCRWWRAVGVIRIHDDKERIPGPYHGVATIIVKRGRYEIMGFTDSRGAPPRQEFRALYKYLNSLGLKKLQHVRAKQGSVIIIPGRYARRPRPERE